MLTTVTPRNVADALVLTWLRLSSALSCVAHGIVAAGCARARPRLSSKRSPAVHDGRAEAKSLSPTQKGLGSDLASRACKCPLFDGSPAEFRKPFANGLLRRRSTSALTGTKKPRDLQGFFKRLMGLEPTTFCMASSGEIPDLR